MHAGILYKKLKRLSYSGGTLTERRPAERRDGSPPTTEVAGGEPFRIMREKRDKSKIKEGRGVITPERYAAWKKANESKSWGKASIIYDPVVGRTVHTLSNAETKVFWRLRFLLEVEEIYEQFPLDKAEVTAICHSLGMRAYSRVLSTDFVVRFKGNIYVAVSVKHSRSIYSPEKNPHYLRDIKRLQVDKIYWEENYNIPLKALFGDEMNDVYVNNIKNVMHFYDQRFVTNKVSKLKFLISHHLISVPMDTDYIRFGALAETMDVEGLYEAYINGSA